MLLIVHVLVVLNAEQAVVIQRGRAMLDARTRGLNVLVTAAQ